MIYGADADDDWTDEAVWRKANPSLGVTVPIDKVRAACNSARQNLPRRTRSGSSG
ncbi:phage terminase large subunit [Cutibacterium acnes JCM 18918]|nr:phage terminase large subunit [Cutibacterium acnes JCM 18918]